MDCIHYQVKYNKIPMLEELDIHTKLSAITLKICCLGFGACGFSGPHKTYTLCNVFACQGLPGYITT